MGIEGGQRNADNENEYGEKILTHDTSFYFTNTSLPLSGICRQGAYFTPVSAFMPGGK
jgi:hypothetical protein